MIKLVFRCLLILLNEGLFESMMALVGMDEVLEELGHLFADGRTHAGVHEVFGANGD